MARPLLLAALLLAACGGGSYDAEAPGRASGVAAPAPPPSPPAVEAAAQDAAPADDAPVARRLIHRATLRLRVDDYAEARRDVTTLADRFQAYVGGEQEQRYPDRVENTLTLRVPSEQFEPLMGALLAVGREVDARTVEVEDVTRQFVDLEARLRARRAVADRLTALLARADRVEDVLAVQTQLGQVQEEIEAAEGQLRYLRNQVALSTITLTLFEESATGVLAGPTFPGRVGEAFEAGWDGLQGLVVALVVLWPLWLLAALVAPVARRLERRRRARRAAA